MIDHSSRNFSFEWPTSLSSGTLSSCAPTTAHKLKRFVLWFCSTRFNSAHYFQDARYTAISKKVKGIQTFRGVTVDNVEIFQNMWALGIEAAICTQNWLEIPLLYVKSIRYDSEEMYAQFTESLLALAMPSNYRVWLLRVSINLILKLMIAYPFFLCEINITAEHHHQPLRYPLHRSSTVPLSRLSLPPLPRLSRSGRPKQATGTLLQCHAH